MLVLVYPSFVVLCFHNTTKTCIRENDNVQLILNTEFMYVSSMV